MNWQERIVSNEGILAGKPIIKNTRLSVEFILERLASGWSEDKIMKGYPRLKPNDFRAIYSYLNDCVKDGLMVAPHQNVG